jgi:two-component system, chemotaxis family, sensor kinase Cph1
MGRIELRKSQISLDGVVESVIAALEPSIAKRLIEWQLKPLPGIKGDSNLIYRALYNLIENAVKYSRYIETARIEIGSIQTKPDFVLIYVKDNGAGFNMKFADKLFKVFERLHPSGEFEGTGIGLASVARIMYRHGGRVWAEAELGVGAVFYLEFPQ